MATQSQLGLAGGRVALGVGDAGERVVHLGEPALAGRSLGVGEAPAQVRLGAVATANQRGSCA